MVFDAPFLPEFAFAADAHDCTTELVHDERRTPTTVLIDDVGFAIDDLAVVDVGVDLPAANAPASGLPTPPEPHSRFEQPLLWYQWVQTPAGNQGSGAFQTTVAVTPGIDPARGSSTLRIVGFRPPKTT